MNTPVNIQENSVQSIGGSRRRSRILWTVAALLVAVVAVFSVVRVWANSAQKEEDARAKGKKKAPVPVSVAAAETGVVSSYISATANLLSDNEVKVLSDADGRVARLLVDEGDWVAKGQTLATVDPQDVQIDLTKRRVKAANARVVYERGERMLAEGLISQETFDKLRMEHDLARQEVAEARHRLGKTTVARAVRRPHHRADDREGPAREARRRAVHARRLRSPGRPHLPAREGGARPRRRAARRASPSRRTRRSASPAASARSARWWTPRRAR